MEIADVQVFTALLLAVHRIAVCEFEQKGSDRFFAKPVEGVRDQRPCRSTVQG
jgi:hypothetical protein